MADVKRWIQCFGGIGASVVELTDEQAASMTTDFQSYVPFDASAHAGFQPRDRVDSDTGKLDSTARLTEDAAAFLELKASLTKAVDLRTLELRANASAVIATAPDLPTAFAQIKQESATRDATAAIIKAQIAAATKPSELPTDL